MTAPIDPKLIQEVRARYRDGKSALIAKFMAGRPSTRSAQQLLTGLAGHVDQTLEALLALSPVPEGLALVAVGGYGRGELFPYSDVDVLVLLPQAASTDGVGDFITACWDTGLEIGSSVRTVEDCVAEAQRDVTVQTALLESRLAAGKRRLFERFRAATAAVLDPRAFLRAKTLEKQQRHVKYDSTPYALEPNCKESPGGLRDLQLLVWVARAAEVSGGQVSLDPADIEDGLRAAAAVGDDTLQRKAQGRVVPDAFTHGTSAQRMRWFRAGAESGDPVACNTFAADRL
jgi:[protein-PII] uridylyltransferase